ncbi:MAG: hypothetical protein CR986_05860 [Ignavibacteriae bacterium]|nr:MAG: hypothetical protein CR986_05860 [Ignavibacteriota bacterium]
MNYLDYILFFIIFIGFILGYKDGIIRKIIGLFGIVIAIFVAVTYSSKLGKYLLPMFNNEEYLAKIISGVIIFFVTIFIFAILKRLIHPSDKVTNFINQILGGIAGTIQILFMVSLILLFLNLISIPSEEDKTNSTLYKPVYSLMPTVIDLIVGKDFKTEGFLKDYIESKNNKELPEEFSNPIDLDTLLNNDN